MRILSLELENIKSYGEPTHIEFTTGLNAVCGLNGAGKTTILESIGFALFDFLAYNQAAFVREGEKSGTIRLHLIARDERGYEIVRRVGSSSQWYVTDIETGTRLAERGESVKLWIKSHLLDIEGDVDLGSLFQNAVGVPQGAMTSDFVRPGTSRKAIFDPLLRVEEYRNAWENLRDTTKYLQDRSADLREQIGRLEGETERISQVEETAAALRSELSESERKLGRLAAELVQLESEKGELDAIENALQGLAEKLMGAQYDVKRYGDALRAREESRNSARAAYGAVQAAQEGYHLFLAAQENLKELDQRRTRRDGLRAALANVKGGIEGTMRTIENLESDLQTARADAIAAGELASWVARQDQLQAAVAGMTARLEGLPDLHAEIARHEASVAEVQERGAERARRIEDARAAASESTKHESVVLELRAVDARLAGIEQLQKELQEVETGGRRLREQYDRCTADAQKAADLNERIEALGAAAEEVEGIAAEFDRLREQLVRVTATIDYQDVARSDLDKRHCPLLDLECPVVAADGTILTRFDIRLRSMADEKLSVEKTISELMPRLNAAKSAEKERGKLQIDLGTVSGAATRKTELEADLAASRARYTSIRDGIAEGAALEERRKRLSEEVARLDALRALAASLPALEEQQSSEEKSLVQTEALLKTLRQRSQDLDVLQGELRQSERELTELANPRERQQRLEASAKRSAEIETRIAAEQSNLAEATLIFNDLQEQLQVYETLEDEIAEQRETETTHRPAYEIYLQNMSEAAGLEDRERAVTEAHALLEEARRQEAAVREQEGEIAATYDRERHTQLKAEHDELRVVVGTAKAAGDRVRMDLTATERELEDLLRRREQLFEKQGEHEELGTVARAVSFIRDTIRAAGPAVTEMLLASISQGANDIFAEIMDDHAAELRWDRDYEVLVQRGAETRKFAQLSGGEQMSAALSVRLALLHEMSEVDFAFFDEPTQNMDAGRRTNLAGQIGQVKGFEQLIVISHDDTFEHHTDNVIRLQKMREETRVESP